MEGLEEYRYSFAKPPPEHKALQQEFEKDFEAYARGGQASFPVTPEFAASVARWPKVPEGFKVTVYRGQPAKYTNLPTGALMSTSVAVERAKAFADKPCCLFEIILLPGTPFLITENMTEYEILVGIPGQEVKSRRELVKSVYTDMGKKRMKVIEVVYGPVNVAPAPGAAAAAAPAEVAPHAGRRKTRRSRKSRKTRSRFT